MSRNYNARSYESDFSEDAEVAELQRSYNLASLCENYLNSRNERLAAASTPYRRRERGMHLRNSPHLSPIRRAARGEGNFRSSSEDEYEVAEMMQPAETSSEAEVCEVAEMRRPVQFDSESDEYEVAEMRAPDGRYFDLEYDFEDMRRAQQRTYDYEEYEVAEMRRPADDYECYSEEEVSEDSVPVMKTPRSPYRHYTYQLDEGVSANMGDTTSPQVAVLRSRRNDSPRSANLSRTYTLSPNSTFESEGEFFEDSELDAPPETPTGRYSGRVRQRGRRVRNCPLDSIRPRRLN